MNDRFLFRAKRKKWRELPKEKWWVEGYYAYMKPYHCIMTKDNFDSWIEIDEKTLCQCTGLKDRNGKLIWENDIVKHYNNQDYPETYDLGIIYWDNYKSGFERTSRTAKENVRINDSCIYEVIGSAFDNPELLDVEE